MASNIIEPKVSVIESIRRTRRLSIHESAHHDWAVERFFRTLVGECVLLLQEVARSIRSKPIGTGGHHLRNASDGAAQDCTLLLPRHHLIDLRPVRWLAVLLDANIVLYRRARLP